MAQLLEGKARKVAIKTLFPNDKRPKFFVKSDVARPCVSYALIIQDLELAIDSVEKAVMMLDKIKNLDDLIVSALWQQAVMAYARCFTSTESGFSKLEAKQCFKTAKARLNHKKLMDFRMSHIAHRGLHKRSRSMMLAVLQQREEGLSFEYSFPTIHELGHYHKRPESVLAFLGELKDRVQQALDKKVSKVDKYIWEDLKQRITSRGVQI